MFGSLLLITIALASLVVGFLILRKGNSTARYFIIGWTVLFISIIEFALTMLGVIESSTFTIYSPVIGTGIEGLFLAFALTHRINLFYESQNLEKTLQLEKSKKTAELANQAKSQFLSNMSHELRTPLNSILGFSQLLRDDEDEKLSKEHLDFVNKIIKSGGYLLSLINELLNLGKIESQDFEVKLSSTSLQNIINEVHEIIDSWRSDHIWLQEGCEWKLRHAVWHEDGEG